MGLTGAEYCLLCLLVEHDGQKTKRHGMRYLMPFRMVMAILCMITHYLFISADYAGRLRKITSHPKCLITVRSFGHRGEGNA